MPMKDELKDMFDALETSAGVVDSTDAPSTDAPSGDQTDAPTTDEPAGTDAPETDAPETRAPKTEPPATSPPEDDEVSRMREENEELKRKIDELSAPKTKAPKTEAPTTDPPIEDEDFTEGMNLDDSDVDPKELNKVLNVIYKKAVQKAREENRKSNETLLREVPKLVTDDMNAQETLQKLTENFYKQNDDLRAFPKAVAAVFDELVEQHPSKKPEEILTLVGKETRSRLGLKEPVRKPNDKKGNKDKDDPPPLHRRKGKRSTQQSEETSGVAKEIDTMNESLNR